MLKEKLVSGVALIFLAAILLSSCDNGGTPSDVTTPSDTTLSGTPSDTTSGKISDTTAPEKEYMTVAAEDAASFRVIRSTKAENYESLLATQFADRLKWNYGPKLSVSSDYLDRGATVDPSANEILIGNTNREESARLISELAKYDGDRFGILTTESKVAVAGTNTQAIYKGLCYLMAQYTVKNGGKSSLSVEKNLLYISDKLELSVFDFSEAAKKGQKLAFYVQKRLTIVPTTGNFSVMQGGGTDGKYAYYGMINKSTLEAIIYKYDLSNWKLVGKSDPLPTAHNNDITYDSKRNKLVISYCSADDGYLGLCYVDPDTLKFDSYFKISTPQRAVEYLPATDQYLLGTNYYFTLTDANYNPISRFNCGSGQYTTQGMCCDDKYVYDVRYISGASTQYIVVHDLNGNYYGEIPLYGAPSEPENMFRLGDGFVVGFNGADAAYSVVLMPEKWW